MNQPLQIYRVTVGGASYWMRLAAPTRDEVRAALIECNEEDALEDEMSPDDFVLLDEAAQHLAMIRDDDDGLRKSLYEFSRLPLYANSKALACSEWS
jgi:hypothetical protein